MLERFSFFHLAILTLVLDFHLVNLSYPTEAIERYVGEIYIQHNPMVADGKVSEVEILYAY
jgi:predicted SnoaL-like aldol condensation-catalyzing enzyme